MKKWLLMLWEAPQLLLGLLLRAIYKGVDSVYEDAIVRRSLKMKGGISLGRYIIISQFATKKTVQHEYGHTIQSKRFGWFYLPLVGLPSIIWAMLYGPVIKPTLNGYYKFITECSADRLGGVER